MYSIVTMVKNSVLHIWKWLKDENSKVLITRKKYDNLYEDGFQVYIVIILQYK